MINIFMLYYEIIFFKALPFLVCSNQLKLQMINRRKVPCNKECCERLDAAHKLANV